MSHFSKIFNEQPIDIPNRSGFDMSFENALTQTVGTLTPILCEEVMPNETFDIGQLSQITLPPMATNFYGRVDLRIEAFFVPMRILWGGWQNFWTMPANNPYSVVTVRPTQVPYGTISGSVDSPSTVLRAGTLADYLGYKAKLASVTQSIPNILPFIAYHRIWDDWYRNSKIQNPAFLNGSAVSTIARAPWYPGVLQVTEDSALADGVSLFSLRQRNWAKDYFTTASLYPQANGGTVGSTVDFTVDTSTGDGSISIGALRSANVLQRWLERNNVCGERYADQIKGQYGVLPSDALLDRPLFLGSNVIPIYNKSVFQTAETGTQSTNPFSGTAGAVSGSSAGFGKGQLVDGFKATEHGYIMILSSIVPHAVYSTGTRRQLLHSKQGDFPIPLLQGLGEQVIYTTELSPATLSTGSIFGYQQQYAENKYHDDELHGLLRDGESLEAFALQRSFPTAPTLGTDFLEIPKSFMDQVTAVAETVSAFGAWADYYISMKKVSPLSEYVIPTLGDLKNTHKESVPYRGRQL